MPEKMCMNYIKRRRAEEYEAAKGKLTAHFEPKVNKTYESYRFRKMHQNEDCVHKSGGTETIDEFVTRLRTAAKGLGKRMQH